MNVGVMTIMRKVHTKAYVSSIAVDDPNVPDEVSLCPMNPGYSCVTCENVDCPDWGTRFASCPDHSRKEKV